MYSVYESGDQPMFFLTFFVMGRFIERQREKERLKARNGTLVSMLVHGYGRRIAEPNICCSLICKTVLLVIPPVWLRKLI
jgi:hypothetical protein